MRDTIVLRMNEITLKKGNRAMFERALVDSVIRRLKPVGVFAVRRDQGNVIAICDTPMNDETVAHAEDAMKKVFGVARILIGSRVTKDIDVIATTATELATGRTGTFKVYSNRTDKTFPLTSPQIAPLIGAAMLEKNPALTVDVHQPQIRVTIDIGTKHAFVAVGETHGAGGLPAGVTGKVVALLSGGIDSPVAAWKTMRRGCKAIFVHFHSRPFVGRASEDKARRLATILAGWQGESVLWTVAIGEAQREIMLKSAEPYRVLLYRRLMIRIAEKIATKEKALALVTGDSIGQVASQTLENIASVSKVATLPVLRPLVGDDKEDIVQVARRIDTYQVSIEAHDDCCSLFMPQNPATRASVKNLDIEERRYDVGALVEAALQAATKEPIAG